MKCHKYICPYRQEEQCTLEEISINEAGQCTEGVTAPYDELIKLAKESGYDNVMDYFKNLALD